MTGKDPAGDNVWVPASVEDREQRDDGERLYLLPAFSDSENSARWVKATDVRTPNRTTVPKQPTPPARPRQGTCGLSNEATHSSLITGHRRTAYGSTARSDETRTAASSPQADRRMGINQGLVCLAYRSRSSAISAMWLRTSRFTWRMSVAIGWPSK